MVLRQGYWYTPEVPVIRIKIDDCPRDFAPYGPIRLALPLKSGYDYGTNDEFETPIHLQADRKGVPQWKGEAVTHHGDGRRFIYLNWLANHAGHPHCFRRIKLFLEHIPDLSPESEGTVTVTIPGRGKDGSPACATVRVVPNKS